MTHEEDEPGPEEVKQWWNELIERGRQDDYAFRWFDISKPCQLEVFWLRDGIEGQLVVNKSNHEQTDKEIKVHGPCGGTDFLDAAEKAVNSDWWQEPASPPRPVLYDRESASRADCLAVVLNDFIEHLQDSIFREFHREGFTMGTSLMGGSMALFVVGSVTTEEVDDHVIVQTTNTESVDTESENTDSQEESQSQTESTDEAVGDSGFGGHIYPAVWVGGPIRRTFKDIVLDTERVDHYPIMRVGFNDTEMIVFNDGFVVTLSDEEEASRILNTLFAVADIFGNQWQSIQHDEISKVEIQSDGGMRLHGGMSLRRQSLRPFGIGTSYPKHRDTIPNERFLGLAEIAEDIYMNEDLSDKLTLHLQAYTHLLDHEFTASFILNWHIVEKHVTDKLNVKLKDEYKVNHDRRGKIKGGGITSKLDLADVTDVLDRPTFEDLDAHKSTRHNIVHSMETASQGQAEELNETVRNILKGDIYRQSDKLKDEIRSRLRQIEST